MKWTSYATAMVCISPVTSHAAVYLSMEQAQQLIFPHSTVKQLDIHLTPEQIQRLKKSSGIFSAFKADQVYRSSDGGWFIVDQVLAKHEMIHYAVGINANGTIRQVEILEYNESYGGQIRDAGWRQQFVGKTIASPVTLNADIHNISGATLSSKHITEGVRRILQFHAMVLTSIQ